MNPIDKNKTGLALGGLFALFHLAWIILVLVGLAQHAVNFIFRLHFITPPYTVGAFNLGNAVLLLIITFIVGYVLGWVFAWFWNYLHRTSSM